MKVFTTIFIILIMLSGLLDAKSYYNPKPVDVSSSEGGSTQKIEYKNPRVVIETDKGNIILEVYLLDVPITAGNFLMLVKNGYYDGIIFHRVEPNYVVQGGDPEGTGYGGPGWTIPDEPTPHKHLRGSVGMAKTPEPNSAGSQFYICLADLPKLDGKYTIFAKVIEGMDVVDRITIGDKMNRVYILEENK